MPLTISDTFATQKNLLHSLEGFLFLFEIGIDNSTSLRLVADHSNFTWNSKTYYAFNIGVGDLQSASDGSLRSMDINISNVNRDFVDRIESLDFIDKPAWFRIAHRSSAAAADVIEQSFQVNKHSMNRRAITFNLAHVNLLQKPFPRETFSRNRCRWVFKDGNCGYAGAIVNCDLILDGTNGCRAHGVNGGGDSTLQPKRYGAWPGIPKTRR
jgi:phage-related protein